MTHFCSPPCFTLPSILGYPQEPSPFTAWNGNWPSRGTSSTLLKIKGKNNYCGYWIITSSSGRTKLGTLQYIGGFPENRSLNFTCTQRSGISSSSQDVQHDESKDFRSQQGNLIPISQMRKGNSQVDRFTCKAYCSRTGILWSPSSHFLTASRESQNQLGWKRLKIKSNH